MAATRLSRIQQGQIVVGGSVASDTVTISTVDPLKSILFYSCRRNDVTGAQGTRLVGVLTDSTTITFYKDDTSHDITVEWQLLEFSSGVVVQHGTTTADSSDINITISSVTLANSFVLCDGYWNDATFTRSVEKVNAALTSPTNLNIERGASISGQRAVYQVVQIDNASVQTDVKNFTLVTDTVTITSVDTSKTFVFTGATDDTGNNVRKIDDWGVSVDLTASDTLTFRHYNNGRSYNCRWYVVTLSDDGFAVQRNNHTFSSTNAENITLNSLLQNYSVAMTGGMGNHMLRSEAGGGGEAYPSGTATKKITSSTNLEVECDGWDSGEASVMDWQVLEFPPAIVKRNQILWFPGIA